MSKLNDKERENLPESAFAFPKERKEPLVDARHVQEALARFDQVKDVTNKERDEAWKRIQQAARFCLCTRRSHILHNLCHGSSDQ